MTTEAEATEATGFAEDQTEAVIDKAALDRDAIAGANAYKKLLQHAGDDWAHWVLVIIGLRALRDLAFAKAHTSNIMSHAYRQEMSALLMLKKYSVYDALDKPTRSCCYKLMDSIDEINVWYATTPGNEKLKWKHPQSIMKHAPRHLVEGGKGGNKPKRERKKPAVSPEVARLRALLIQVIKELIEFKPEARKYLDLLDPADPQDDLDDIF
jgi:hypothetical protein